MERKDELLFKLKLYLKEIDLIQVALSTYNCECEYRDELIKEQDMLLSFIESLFEEATNDDNHKLSMYVSRWALMMEWIVQKKKHISSRMLRVNNKNVLEAKIEGIKSMLW